MEHPICDKLRRGIRQVPDFPKPGINFYDVTTILKDAALFRATVDVLHSRYQAMGPEAIVGIEARGFVFGGALASLIFIRVLEPLMATDKDACNCKVR